MEIVLQCTVFVTLLSSHLYIILFEAIRQLELPTSLVLLMSEAYGRQSGEEEQRGGGNFQIVRCCCLCVKYWTERAAQGGGGGRDCPRVGGWMFLLPVVRTTYICRVSDNRVS